MAQENQECLGPSMGLFEFLLLRLRIQENDQTQQKTHIYVDWGIFCSVDNVKRWLSNASGKYGWKMFNHIVNVLVNHIDMVEQCYWCHWKHNPLLSKKCPQRSLNQTEVSYNKMCPRDRWMLSYVDLLGGYWFDYSWKNHPWTKIFHI